MPELVLYGTRLLVSVLEIEWRTLSKGADNTMLPNTVKTDNSGLELTADILEEIFTNRDFPSAAPKLSQSLAKTGKSRADLWNFAQAVAVERGINNNNNKCEQVSEVLVQGISGYYFWII